MANRGTELEPVPWKISDVVVAMALVIAGFLLILFVAGLVLQAAGVRQSTLLSPWLTGTLEGLMLLAVWIFGIRKYRTQWSKVGLRLWESRWSFILPWVGLIASLAFTSFYAWAVSELGLEILEPQPVPQEALGEGITRLLNIGVITLWGPFTEEVFFRGFVMVAFLSVMGPVRGVLVSAAIFAGAHLMLGTMIPIFVTGIILAWLYLKTKSLWPPIVAHAAQNLLALSVVS